MERTQKKEGGKCCVFAGKYDILMGNTRQIMFNSAVDGEAEGRKGSETK